jgi:hypothetical protein
MHIAEVKVNEIPRDESLPVLYSACIPVMGTPTIMQIGVWRGLGSVIFLLCTIFDASKQSLTLPGESFFQKTIR